MLAPQETPAHRFWTMFSEHTGQLVAEAERILGSQLREAPFGFRNLSRDPHHGAGELRAGRSTFRLECPLFGIAPGPTESRLAAIFGEETLLVRVYVYRDSGKAAPTLHSWLAADLGGDRWSSGEPDLGPAPLSDPDTLDLFIWSLLSASHP